MWFIFFFALADHQNSHCNAFIETLPYGDTPAFEPAILSLHVAVIARFCYEAALLRIRQCGQNIETMRTQAKAEQLLMSFYNCTLPAISVPSTDDSVPRHQPPSVDLLEVNSPWMLRQYEPVSVAGDGNCLFRAVSYALYSTDKYYMQLRLLCVIEILLSADFYDSASTSFYGPYAAISGYSYMTTRHCVLNSCL